jgi:hypothetical protein
MQSLSSALPGYTTSQPRLSSPPPWEPQISHDNEVAAFIQIFRNSIVFGCDARRGRAYVTVVTEIINSYFITGVEPE